MPGSPAIGLRPATLTIPCILRANSEGRRGWRALECIGNLALRGGGSPPSLAGPWPGPRGKEYIHLLASSPGPDAVLTRRGPDGVPRSPVPPRSAPAAEPPMRRGSALDHAKHEHSGLDPCRARRGGRMLDRTGRASGHGSDRSTAINRLAVELRQHGQVDHSRPGLTRSARARSPPRERRRRA